MKYNMEDFFYDALDVLKNVGVWIVGITLLALLSLMILASWLLMWDIAPKILHLNPNCSITCDK